MWRVLRVTILLVVLLIVAGQAWQDRFLTTRWQRTVYVGAFPINADGSDITDNYLARLDQRQIDEVGQFLKSEAHRYGVAVDDPITLTLYPATTERPPVLDPAAGVLERALWSLKLRFYRSHVIAASGRVHPKIALFLLYHDPALVQRLPHSAGLQRGLTAVVHLFASRAQDAQNRIVITHELLHTFGATDKYDLSTGQPRYPDGFGEPELDPRYPQRLGEIMAGRVPLNESESHLPEGLAEERVGPVTAHEIGWVSH